ncbi:glycosyltransferase family 4 protein [Rhodococcus sp. NPDC078407]|uniref:glycosyltransferase family 4 protein n=1 Tax=Rhodococcus sp. NPDC078407 TaxID=3364509 RepID=UPI0037C73D29
MKSYDIVVCFGTWELLEVLTAARLARKPCVLDLHETFSGTGGNKILNLLSRFLSGVIATSAGAANPIHSTVKRCVVPRPVSLTRFLPEPHQVRAQNSLAIVGQVVPHKRVLKLLEAVDAVEDFTLSVSIVGISPLGFRSSYEQVVSRHAEKSRHQIVLVDKTDNVAEHLKNAYVVVNVSEHEAFGRTVIEGLAAGCFPIVSSGTGTEEIVVRAGVGWVVSDAGGSLSEAIRRYFILPELTKSEMSVEATQSAQKYASDLIAGEYLSALKKMGVFGAA